VNVLSSRGNSKAFLRMSIVKKTIAFSNLGIGFLFGIEGFLYGLVIVAFINTSITIFVVSREIKLNPLEFYKLIVSQGFIAILSVFVTLKLVGESIEIEVISMLLKGALFLAIYLTSNWIIKPSPYLYVIEQIKNIKDKRRST